MAVEELHLIGSQYICSVSRKVCSLYCILLVPYVSSEEILCKQCAPSVPTATLSRIELIWANYLSVL